MTSKTPKIKRVSTLGGNPFITSNPPSPGLTGGPDLEKIIEMNKNLKSPDPKVYEGHKDLIDKVIHRTRREQMGDDKVYIIHPKYRKHCSDIFGSIYKFSNDFKDCKQLVIYGKYIFIELEDGITIKYPYMRFKDECFKLSVFDYYEDSDADDDDDDNDSDESCDDDDNDSDESCDDDDDDDE